ncbi:f-box family protein [Corchorus capsularis]|uniref:F-box family protein n=1 Tax=Corchorus capsularis TaxID=210143 RepID=A0A1R3KWI2_COCAP|nr:f-box family protein [Corchorus capsularis]
MEPSNSNPIDSARNNLCCLPEDVLAMILKRHDDAKHLLRISLASKQLASLVSDMDSVTLNCEFSRSDHKFDQILHGLFNRFQKLQHFRIVFHAPIFEMHEPLERCQVAIGSEFELAYLLPARPDDSDSPPSIWSRAFDDMARIESESEALPHRVIRELRSKRDRVLVQILQANLGVAHLSSLIMPIVVFKNRKLKSIAISDQLKRWMVCMGEEEIAKSASKPLALAYPEKLDFVEVNLWEAPLLDLPALGLGYALQDVKFLQVKPGGRGKPPIPHPDSLQKFVWSNSDSDPDWTVLSEASKEIMFNPNIKKCSILINSEMLFGLFNPFLKDLYKDVPPTRYVNFDQLVRLS